MSDQVTRNNHYVPRWYQRGFFESDQLHLYYLDKSPEQKMLPDGRVVSRKAVYKRGPNGCFCEYDLYSIHLGMMVKDEVEKFFFGSIDVRGAKAVRAFASGNLLEVDKSFKNFFEYLGVQKLRTPKGLDWIKSRYPSLDQPQLMQEMQNLRSMHYIMWTEGVREIVSAEESDVKFIVSDHPVTVYNAAVLPASPRCAYPDDVSVELLGSQTIFVLDANTCLILTHLEYAQDPKGCNLIAPRTHARYYGQSLVRTYNFIRTRKLLREDVITINYLLKSRAGRYLAASKEEWLYPEKSFTGVWQDIAQVLLPRDELWQCDGEIYVGYPDGSMQYQDAFGRTSGAHEYLRRKKPETDLGPNDFCGCGSGLKFKRCCNDLPLEDRPTWDVYGIRERNLMFSHVVQDILGLKSGKTWDDVRSELSSEHVKHIHEKFASFWPDDTDLFELLPRPRKNIFRAVYLGLSHPHKVKEMVLGWLPYFDQIILVHPFINPLHIKPELSPTEFPSQYKAQTLRNVLLLLLLEPFIRAGYVHLIPDPRDLNEQFRMSVCQMAKQDTVGWKPDLSGTGCLEKLLEYDFFCSMSRFPESYLRQLIRRQTSEASDAEIESAIRNMKLALAADPYALLQPMEPGEELIGSKGFSLESAMYLASFTGSVIYTDVEEYWQRLHRHAQVDSGPNTAWGSVIDNLRSMNFPIDVNWQTLYKALRTGRYGNMKAVLRRFFDAVQQSNRTTQPEQIALQLTKAYQATQSEWIGMSDRFSFTGHIKLSVPSGGFECTGLRRLLLTFGRAKPFRPIPFAMLINLQRPNAVDGN